MGPGRCEEWNQPQVWGCRWLQRQSKAPNPISASWGPLTPSPKSLKTRSWWGEGAAHRGWSHAGWCWCVGLCWGWQVSGAGTPLFCSPTGCTGAGGCPLFRPVLVPDGRLGAVLVERSLPKMIPSSEGWGKGLPGAPPGPSRAGGTWLGWGGSGALVGSVAAGSSVPPHGQLLVCPQPWSGSWYWECSW